MCMLAVDRWPPSVARSLPPERQTHPFCLALQRSRRAPPTQPLKLSRSAGTSSIMEPHLALPQSHTMGAPVKPAGMWTGRYHNTLPQVSQGKEARWGQWRSSAARLTFKASEILGSTGPQCTLGCSTPGGQEPQEMPFLTEGVVSVMRPHRREAKALMCLTYRAA